MSALTDLVAKNLAELRKSRGLTQGQLAEKFSYSDKSVSKWEHGEVMPDLDTLQQLADFYGVTLDYFTHEPTEDNKKLYTKAKEPSQGAKHWFAIAMTMTFIWVVGAVACVAIYVNGFTHAASPWLPFVWCAVVSFLDLAIVFTFWHEKKTAIAFWLVFVWVLLTAMYVNMGVYMNDGAGWKIWVIYIIGIPATIGILLASKFKKAE